MTAITQTTYKITCNICEYIANVLKNTVNTMVRNRQLAANTEVARQLQQLGFYGNDKDLKHIIMQLNDKTAREYEKRS
jgi:hypothetical protein